MLNNFLRKVQELYLQCSELLRPNLLLMTFVWLPKVLNYLWLGFWFTSLCTYSFQGPCLSCIVIINCESNHGNLEVP